MSDLLILSHLSRHHRNHHISHPPHHHDVRLGQYRPAVGCGCDVIGRHCANTQHRHLHPLDLHHQHLKHHHCTTSCTITGQHTASSLAPSRPPPPPSQPLQCTITLISIVTNTISTSTTTRASKYDVPTHTALSPSSPPS